ncbi:MAG: hypothetical protein ABR577_07375 [Pyrinomonadaceae bacterium]
MRNPRFVVLHLITISVYLIHLIVMPFSLSAQQRRPSKSSVPQRGGSPTIRKPDSTRIDIAFLKKKTSELGIFFSDKPSVPISMINTAYDQKYHGELRDVGFTPDGGWYVTAVDGGIKYGGLPSDVKIKLNELTNNGYFHERFREMAFSPNGAWIIPYGTNECNYAPNKLPEKMLEGAKYIYNRWGKGAFCRKFISVAFAPNNSWIIVYRTDNDEVSQLKWDAMWDGIVQKDFEQKMIEFIDKQIAVKQVAFSQNGGWIILFNDNEFESNNIPQELLKLLLEMNRQGKRIDQVAFAPNGGWVVIGKGLASWY